LWKHHFADNRDLYVSLHPDQGGTGQVRVRLFSVSNVTGAGTLGGSQIPTTIGTPGQNARITFPGTQGSRYSIAFTGASFTANPVLNPYGPENFMFQVLRPDGTLFASPSGYGATQTSGFIENDDTITLPTTAVWINFPAPKRLLAPLH